jgi:HK97 family phage portal protein
MTLLESIRTEYRALLLPAAPKAISYRPDLAGREHVFSTVGGHGAYITETADQYADYAKVFQTYSWARKAISKVAENLAGLPVRVVGKDDEPQEQHPVSILLNRGNDSHSPIEQWQAYAVSMMLAGENFFEIVPDGRGRPAELWHRRCDWVSIHPDVTPERLLYPKVAAYTYMHEGVDTPLVLPAESMIHDKFYNPLSLWRGLAPISAVREGIIIDLFSQAWSKRFIRSNARPDFAIVAPQGITQSEKGAILAQFMANYSGPDNWHRPAVLEEGVTDIKPFSFAPKDMEWLEQRRFSRDEVGAIFGVPDEIMGYGKDTYENFQTALEVFWTLTVKPLADHRDNRLTHFFTYTVPLLKPGERVASDFSRVDVFQEDLTGKLDNALKMTQLLSEPPSAIRLVNDRLELGIDESALTKVEAEQEKRRQEQQEQFEQRFRQQDGEQDDEQESGPVQRFFTQATGKITPSVVKVLRLQLDRDDDEAELVLRMALEARNERNIRRAFANMLETLLPTGGAETDPNEIAIRIQRELRLSQDLQDALTRALQDSADLGVSVAVDQLNNVGFGFDWTLANETATAWVNTYRFDLIRNVEETTIRRTRQAVARWVTNGEPLESLVRDLEPVYGRKRAGLIAATETTRSYSNANQIAYQESGVVQRIEVQTARDERVCPICGSIWGRRFPLATGVPNMGLPPFHPGCRCWILPVVD